MHDQPSVSELIQAVKNFIDDTASPNLSGHAAFHARVASNVLATVLRDLDQRAEADEAERAGLIKLLSASDDVSLDELNAQLCKAIQTREMGVADMDLLTHLKQTTMAQLEVDQPRYSGLKIAKDS